MSSSSDDGGGPFPGMFSAATPMPGLPVAGKDSTIGDPYEYGKFQSFLPDAKGSGPNDSATGLRPEMFQYQKPGGVADPQIAQLRDELAKLKATPAPSPSPAPGPAASGGIKYLPDGQIDQQDPGNIAEYYRLMSGGR